MGVHTARAGGHGERGACRGSAREALITDLEPVEAVVSVVGESQDTLTLGNR